jgi:hypothetical protein
VADVQIADLRTSGLAADRPAAADALEYYATDTKVRSRSDGATWSDEPAKVETHVHAGSDITSGTVADAQIDAALARDSEVTSAIGTHAGIATAHGTFANASHSHAAGDLPDLDSLTTPSADVSLNSKKIINLADGASSGDAVNKGQMDAAVAAGVSFATPTVTYGTPAPGAASTAIRSDAVLPLPPGSQMDYVEKTTAVAVTATTEAGATVLVTGSSVTYDGSTPVWVEYFATDMAPGSTYIIVVLWDDTANVSLGYLALSFSRGPFTGRRRLTPAAGARVYSIRGFVDAGSGGPTNGGGGVGVRLPGYIRITRA